MLCSIRRLLFPSVLLLWVGCGGADQPAEGSREPEAAQLPAAQAPVVDVVARGLTFEAPTEVPAGWTTIRFTNESGMVHFAAVELLPQGYGVVEQQEEIAPIFQTGMDLLVRGEPDAAMEEFGTIPDWFSEIVFMGGPGLTSPGLTSQATVFLTPGTYLLECYVKTDGIFHSFNPSPDSLGMVHEFVVTDEASVVPEPSADLHVSISSEHGIQVEGDPSEGQTTVAVHFLDQTAHENFVGHDLHVARLDEETDLEELAVWMDWTQPGGLETPAPVEFIGGTNEMPSGQTAYFTVNLEPGRYAWVSEVTNPLEKGMLQVFEVPAM